MEDEEEKEPGDEEQKSVSEKPASLEEITSAKSGSKTPTDDPNADNVTGVKSHISNKTFPESKIPEIEDNLIPAFNGSKTPSIEHNVTSGTVVKSLSSNKTSESRTPGLEDNLIPAFNGSKTSSVDPFVTTTNGVKSLSSNKTSESRTPVIEGSLIPAFSAINNVKMIYKSTEELNDNQVVGRPNGRAGSDGRNGGGPGGSGFGGFGNFPCATMFNKRSPFIHNPPQPEVRRARIDHPRTPKEYIINLREDLADFQESHGLPRTRDYSFLSLGLALAQETARAIYSLFLMFAELFPILAVVSLILRFALDKLIEILETPEPVDKMKKSIIFGLQMVVILIPLWILIGTIIIPLITVIFSVLQRVLRIKGGKKKSSKSKCSSKPKTTCDYIF